MIVEPWAEETMLRMVDQHFHVVSTSLEATGQFDDLALCTTGPEVVNNQQHFHAKLAITDLRLCQT